MRKRIINVLLTPGVEQNEQHMSFIPEAEVQIDGKRIVYAGAMAGAPRFEADETIDGMGCLAMPGLVNLHTHTPMTLLRGVGSDLTLEHWLHEAIFPLEANWDDDLIKTGTELGMLEMLRFGTTSFCDMYMHTDVMAQAVRDAGMRALLGHGVVDFDESCADLIPGVEMAQKWHKSCDDRIRFSLAPHSEGATTPVLIAKVARLAKQMGLTIHVHVSETKLDRDESLQRRGMKPPAYLESLGIFESPVIAAHCVWFDDDDIEIFRRHGAVIVHNPVSNLKLASGVAPVAKMLERSCKVALGTDGVASNNDLNLWEEIKLMPMLQKGTTLDPTVVSPAQTLAAATSVGAKALGYDDLGLLKAGYLADLILVDLHTPQCVPCNDVESNLVYSVQGSDVRLTMVNGSVLYRDGEYPTLDKASVLRRAGEAARELERRRDEKARA
ncbi:MAG: amidohydrolase [Eubacteriales bacterium]|nr:amidohydrolase [Eubacteriales bacterium]